MRTLKDYCYSTAVLPDLANEINTHTHAEQRALDLMMQAHLRDREIDNRLMRAAVQASSKRELDNALAAMQLRLDGVEKARLKKLTMGTK